MNSKLILILCLLFIGCGKSTQKKQNQTPNIIFIMSDDHTSQAWGIYGGVLEKYAINQNIKRLAAEGVVLENVFAPTLFVFPVGPPYLQANTVIKIRFTRFLMPLMLINSM